MYYLELIAQSKYTITTTYNWLPITFSFQACSSLHRIWSPWLRCPMASSNQYVDSLVLLEDSNWLRNGASPEHGSVKCVFMVDR